jgi:hypothetical protein
MKSIGIWIVIVAIAYFVVNMQQADQDEAGAIIGADNIDAFKIQVGDCYNDEVAAEKSEESTEVTNVAGLPCTEPHDNEVYAVFNTTLTEFPGAEEMSNQSFEECLGRFDKFVGTKYEDSQLDITVMYPTSESWIELADREIICVLYDLDLVKLEGGMRDSKI